MSIRINLNNLNTLALQFNQSQERISDMIQLLNRHLHVLLLNVTAAQTNAIDHAQTELDYELKSYLRTLDDIHHLLCYTESRMKKSDQILAAQLFQHSGQLADYSHIMTFLATSGLSADQFKLELSILSEPRFLMNELKKNGLTGLLTNAHNGACFQFDDQGKRSLWSARQLFNNRVVKNLCLLAYQHVAKGPLSLTVSCITKQASNVQTVYLPKNTPQPLS
ncbi:hypothetical protein HOO54_08650 [Bacillus sp. WMMC1349]|uniref:hypothetical protein n=1 Tax=Bacillus sp. WMMC1349 TaxID=2736254 RepID=UPI00155498AB|nr:hypothetical protein [Bacillus sp. WMMC1349]NPC92289.1 hypothetical protein [Bacillus sp. WMMC1349]